MAIEATELVELPPVEAARLLEKNAEAGWLAELQLVLDRRLARPDLDRVLAVWDLSQSDAAGLFGVSRQAIAKWRSHGVPASRIEPLGDLSAATDLLVRFLKRDRIPVVVRRPSDRLGGRSLLDLVAEGRTREVLGACRAMFAFDDVHA